MTTIITLEHEGINLEHFLGWLLKEKLGFDVKEYLSFVEKEKLLTQKRDLNKRLKHIARLLDEIESGEYYDPFLHDLLDFLKKEEPKLRLRLQRLIDKSSSEEG